jgi:hypothetical protein
MPFRFFRAVLAAGLVVSVTPAVAQDAPDLTGKWTGAFTGGVRFGGGDLAPADETPTFVHAEGRPEYTLTIEKQEGRGLMGTWGSVDGAETIQGVLRLDNTELLFVDEDSFFNGRLISATEMEFCNQTLALNERMALCLLLKKQ